MELFSEERKKGCCFTGHRNLTEKELEVASNKISLLIPKLIDEGISHFYAGGALGFDFAAAVTVINYKAIYPQIKLTLALPCRNYTKKWSRLEIQLFERVIARADETIYVSEEYSRACMQMRNKYMVDRSSICLCWLSSSKGGTFNTVSYAKKQGIKVINLTSGYSGEQLGFDFNG
ncbi:MAG: DUF1273 family protein [Clostridia bacterium]|nr:DUF1273 family protein [Clostridia bacterium]